MGRRTALVALAEFAAGSYHSVMAIGTVERSPAVNAAEHSALRATLGVGNVFILAIAGSLLLWAALPPLDLWPLAWVATIPWLWLIRRRSLVDRVAATDDKKHIRWRWLNPIRVAWRAAGRRLPGYREIWLAGFVFWLLAIHWLRHPHPATHLGWIALSFYLAFYLPIFIGLSRVAVHRLNVPLVVAAPVVWTGLELARAHLLTGFLMAALGHTQYHWIALIQISDLAGAYAVSFVVMFAAACFASTVPMDGRGFRWRLGIAAAGAIGAALIYGNYRLAQDAFTPGPTVALIQGSTQADWKADPGRNQRIHDEYWRQSEKAVREAGGKVDLIVWPETMFRGLVFDFGEGGRFGDGAPEGARLADESTRRLLRSTKLELGAPLLVGVDGVNIDGDEFERFNSAVCLNENGVMLDRYDKMHLVMFGEYIPFAEFFPALYRLTPLSGGIGAGDRSVAFEVGGVCYVPNICYESVIPHVIRRQVRELEQQGRPADVLVNLTNDAWFWESSELDMHLVCGVFRAVELRRPFLIAANRGLTAAIDSGGRIVEQAPRGTAEHVIAEIPLDRRTSLYSRLGDWPAGLCLAFCGFLAVVGVFRRQ